MLFDNGSRYDYNYKLVCDKCGHDGEEFEKTMIDNEYVQYTCKCGEKCWLPRGWKQMPKWRPITNE